MLYTRKGDGGTSGLFGTKERLPKDSSIYNALGTLDELNSLLGVCRAKAAELQGEDELDIAKEVLRVQECLFIAQAELAGAQKNITQAHVDALETVIAVVEGLIENPHAFVIPGTTELSGFLDYARAVSRRAERAVVSERETRPASPTTNAYLNRLSSFLYVLARYTAGRAGKTEPSPSY